ncbi:hypothetical protein QWZ10_05880 [Paracoccus cavernae]|uniref:Uncharacterized protein n=1 Tax=Paracoccus cavernae TaxID=1571207 RepID=A0ABT8D8A0_9RHOB|nr:hypothetical protein [Paracoccus cavernae]
MTAPDLILTNARILTMDPDRPAPRPFPCRAAASSRSDARTKSRLRRVP